MIICSCNYVSESEIKASIDYGFSSIEDIADATGAGTCCGICHECIEQLIDASKLEI